MDIRSVLQELDSWPVEEQAKLAQILWDRLGEAGNGPAPTTAQIAELERRIDELEENPQSTIPWEEVEKYVRRNR